MSRMTAIMAVDNVTAFSDWGESVTYRRVISTTSFRTGDTTEVATDTTVSAIISDVNSKQIPGSGGRYQAGDRYFRIQDSEIPEKPPERTSRIIHDGMTFQVTAWFKAASGLNWDVLGRLT